MSGLTLDVRLLFTKKPTRVNVAELAARTPPAVIQPYERAAAQAGNATFETGLAASGSGVRAHPAEPAQTAAAGEPAEATELAEAGLVREARLRRRRRYPFRRTSRDPRRPPRRARRRIRYLFRLPPRAPRK